MALYPSRDSPCTVTECVQEMKSILLRGEHKNCPCTFTEGTGGDLCVLDYHSLCNLLDLKLSFFTCFRRVAQTLVQIQRKQNVLTLQLR